MWGVGLVGLAWGVVEIFKRRVYLVGITQPLWACGSLVRNAGQNVLVLCDARSKAEQLKGMPSLDLMPIVKAETSNACGGRRCSTSIERAATARF